eukprot:351805-Chlamydomonas_euryale.AAC.6
MQSWQSQARPGQAISMDAQQPAELTQEQVCTGQLDKSLMRPPRAALAELDCRLVNVHPEAVNAIHSPAFHILHAV